MNYEVGRQSHLASFTVRTLNLYYRVKAAARDVLVAGQLMIGHALAAIAVIIEDGSIRLVITQRRMLFRDHARHNVVHRHSFG